MRLNIVSLICSIPFLYSCGEKIDNNEIKFVLLDKKNNVHDSTYYDVKMINDSMYSIKILNRPEVYLYESRDGIFQSPKKTNFKLSYSFVDSNFHTNRVNPFNSVNSIRLTQKQIYNIKDTSISVYRYFETPDTDYTRMSHSGSITYYVPKIGLIMISVPEQENSYTRKFEQNEIGNLIINKILRDSTFYDQILFNDPVVKTLKYLPPE